MRGRGRAGQAVRLAPPSLKWFRPTALSSKEFKFVALRLAPARLPAAELLRLRPRMPAIPAVSLHRALPPAVVLRVHPIRGVSSLRPSRASPGPGFLGRNMVNAYDAKDYLMKRLAARQQIPFTPIQAFGLPFDEYLVQRPLPATDKDAKTHVKSHR